MSKYSIITLFSPLIFSVFWLITLIQFQRNEVSAFESWVLTRQVNFASDAAIEELRTKSPDVALNIEEKSPTVNPDVAVEEFASMLCDNFGLPDNQFNRDRICRRYVKCLCVCTNYGYYIYMSKQVTGHGDTTPTWEFVSWPILPYVDELDSLGYGKVAVTLNKDYIYEVEKDTSTSTYYNVRRHEAAAGVPYEMTEAEKLKASEIINNTVTNTMMRALYSEYGNKSDQTIELPAAFDTITGAQIINNTTVLGIVDTTGRAIGIETVAFGVGGTQIKEADPIIGWYGPNPKWLFDQLELSPSGIDEDLYNNKYKINNRTSPTMGLPYSKWWTTTSKLKRLCKDKNWSINYVLAGLESERKIFDTKYQAAAAGYDECWAIMGYDMNEKKED